MAWEVRGEGWKVTVSNPCFPCTNPCLKADRSQWKRLRSDGWRFTLRHTHNPPTRAVITRSLPPPLYSPPLGQKLSIKKQTKEEKKQERRARVERGRYGGKSDKRERKGWRGWKMEVVGVVVVEDRKEVTWPRGSCKAESERERVSERSRKTTVRRNSECDGECLWIIWTFTLWLVREWDLQMRKKEREKE